MAAQQVKFKPSIQSNNLAEQVANEELRKTDNFDTLKKSYLNLMQQLEIDGIPKEKVSTVGQKIVLEKKRKKLVEQKATPEEIKNVYIGRWWYVIAKENNYIDPVMSRRDGGAVMHQENSSPSEIEKENSQYIKLIYETIEFLKDIALPKLKENHFISLLDDDKNILLALHDWKAQLDIAKSFFNHKEKIPVNTQHILLHCIGTISSNNEAALEYFNHRQKAHQITSKQISKYRSGEIKNSLQLFKPKDRISAILWNYFGLQCTQCNSWRVTEIKTGFVKCADCENTFETTSTIKCNYCAFPFFEDEIAYIKEKGSKCPNCKEELPEYLINYILR